MAGYSGKPLLDKLGVKPGMRVAVLGLVDPGFHRRLAARTPNVTEGRVGRDHDLVFLAIESPAKLSRLAALQRAIKRDGAIWAIWPKGGRAVNENTIRDAAIAAGLVDVKVAAFSERLSALKLVIPLAKR